MVSVSRNASPLHLGTKKLDEEKLHQTATNSLLQGFESNYRTFHQSAEIPHHLGHHIVFFFVFINTII